MGSKRLCSATRSAEGVGLAGDQADHSRYGAMNPQATATGSDAVMVGIGSQRAKRPVAAAFSLMEIVAAVAILAILAAAMLPVLVRQIDYATEGIEQTNLVSIANGFTQGALATRYIPSQANWANFVATNLGWEVSTVQTNNRNNSRVFLIDPQLRIGTNTALPYVQSGTGAAGITNVRFMIVSSLSSGLPGGLVSGVPSLASDF